jgi:hypothetical protein
MRQLVAIAFALAACSVSAADPSDEKCIYDQEELLSLDEAAFDQDLPNGGWRKIGNIPGCEAAAAELIAAVT